MVADAEGHTAAVEVRIDAPPEVVWPLVVDISTPVAFSTELRSTEWIDEGPAVGARFRGHNSHPAIGDWSMTCTVTTLEHGRAFEWTVGDLDDEVARWRFDLVPSATGTTLRFSARVGPGRSGLTAAIEAMPERADAVIESRLRQWTDNMRRTAEGIKGLAEA